MGSFEASTEVAQEIRYMGGHNVSLSHRMTLQRSQSFYPSHTKVALAFYTVPLQRRMTSNVSLSMTLLIHMGVGIQRMSLQRSLNFNLVCLFSTSGPIVGLRSHLDHHLTFGVLKTLGYGKLDWVILHLRLPKRHFRPLPNSWKQRKTWHHTPLWRITSKRDSLD